MSKLRGRGESFGRLGFGVPYAKACYPFFVWWSQLLLTGFEPGDVFLNGPDCGDVPIPMAHNALVRRFLESDADTLCIIEDDHSGDRDTIRRLRSNPANLDFDIVCANYVNRRPPVRIIGGDLGEANAYGEVTWHSDQLAVPRTGTQAVDCAALGLVLIRRWVLQAMLGGDDPEEFFWFEWRGRNSQDIQFYRMARLVGARVGVDRDTSIAHWGQYSYTVEQFYKLQEAARKEQEATNDG